MTHFIFVGQLCLALIFLVLNFYYLSSTWLKQSNLLIFNFFMHHEFLRNNIGMLDMLHFWVNLYSHIKT